MKQHLRKLHRLLLALAVSLLLLLAAVPAFAADAESTPADAEAADVAAALHLISIYEMFPMGDLSQATDMESLLRLVQEGDPYAAYYDPASTEAFTNVYHGDYVGVGVRLSKGDPYIVFNMVYPDGPAAAAGFQSGDVVVTIDGHPTEEMTAEEASQLLTGGAPGTLVRVVVKRGETEFSMAITRRIMANPSVNYHMHDDTTGYLQVERFTVDTAEQVETALSYLQEKGMTRLLLDLRNCPGGTMESAAATAAMLNGEPLVFYYAVGDTYLQLRAAHEASQKAIPDLPIAVLVNGHTASAAEMVTAVLQDTDSACVVGIKTYGKGVCQATFNLPSGALLSLTTQRYLSIGLQDVHAAGGVFPDLWTTGDAKALALAWLDAAEQEADTLSLPMGAAYAFRNGEEIPLGKACLLQNGASYAPAEEVLSALGFQPVERGGSVYAYTTDASLFLDREKREVRIGMMTAPLLQIDGTDYLPLAFLRQAGYRVEWDNATRSVHIGK